MADKPKTYAQQVHELKDQLQQKDELITKLEGNSSLITELELQVSELEAEVDHYKQIAQQNGVNNKAQITDLEQRALSAEQGLRNAQANFQRAATESEALQQQLDVVGAELEKHRGKDEKIILLSEQLKDSNNRISELHRQYQELQIKSNEDVARFEKNSHFARREIEELRKVIEELNENLANKILEIESLKTDYSDRLVTIYNQNQDLKTQLNAANARLNTLRETLG